MSYALDPARPTGEDIKRIAVAQLQLARESLHAFPRDPGGVHEARKSLKRLRALLRLARAPLGEIFHRENVVYRDLARSLAGLRDVQSLLELLPRLRKQAPRELTRNGLQRLRSALQAVERGKEAPSAQISATLAALDEAQQRVAGWPSFPQEPEWLVEGAARSYRNARRSMRAARDLTSPEAFHEWRKQVKHHAYQLRLLEPLWPEFYRAQRKLMDELADVLGEEHDAALFLAELKGELGAALRPAARLCWEAVAERYQAAQRRQAESLGRRMFAEGREAFAQRLAATLESLPPPTSGLTKQLPRQPQRGAGEQRTDHPDMKPE